MFFIKSGGVGAKCDHFKVGVRIRVCVHLNLDVRGACAHVQCAVERVRAKSILESVRCACVRPFFGCAMCDRTFAHFLGQNCQF